MIPPMPRPRTERTERLNLFLTKAERDAIGVIAKREDRDAGYIAAWFVRWATQLYFALDEPLATMGKLHLQSEPQIKEESKFWLELRQIEQVTMQQIKEAQRNGSNGESRKKKRAEKEHNRI